VQHERQRGVEGQQTFWGKGVVDSASERIMVISLAMARAIMPRACFGSI